MTQEVIKPAGTGPTTTPLSPGIRANGFIFVSGQTGRSPQTGAIPEGMAAQAKQGLENMKAVLEAGGSSMDKVVKCLVFVTDISRFGEMNEVYRTYFPSDRFPARSTVEVSSLANKDMLFEVEAIALA
ncbi:MAG TPA: RidA family protein [Chloroflexota bacterium]|jgi:2-iminobutanoate/2-iminopropanoate deaminase|nr:RidA family protein [Chloroflexota bacterium]